MINEDRKNFMKDFFTIVPRLIATSLFCLLFERKSLKAFSYVYNKRKEIIGIRKIVQGKRTISANTFRQYLNWDAPVAGSTISNKSENFAMGV
jgi:hypothetical protein